MKNLVFGFLMVFCSAFYLDAQNITLTTQAEVDAFLATSVAGDLTVEGPDIDDLSPLGSITEIGGSLTIKNNSGLTSISGFNSLNTVTDVNIFQNNSLSQLTGFGSLTSVGTLFLTNNTSLANLSGFGSLNTIDRLHILGSDLERIDGFGNLSSINTLVNVQNNSDLCGCEVLAPALENSPPPSSSINLSNSVICSSTSGCNSVSEIISSYCSQDLNLSSQAEVDAFFCTSVSGDLTIESLFQISDLSGLSGLESVGGDLIIRNINNLTSLSGLEDLESIGGNLVLSFLPGVSDFSALDNLLSVNNVTLEFLNGTTDLDVLNSLTSAGNILIRLNSSIETVSGFGSLESANTINVRQNPSLLNLAGFDGVTSLANVIIEQNNSLDNCVFVAPLLLATTPIFASINNNLVPGCCSSPMTVVSSACFFQCPAGSAVGNSLAFDGSDDYVNLDAALVGLDGLADFTIEFWMKADAADVSGPRSMMFSHNAPAPGDNKFLLILNGQSIASPGRISIVDEDNGFEYTSQANVGDDDWHHVAYSRDNGIGSLFIDGVLDGTHPSVTTFSLNDRLSLGQDFDGSNTSDFYNGNLAEVRIWAAPRTTNQILASQQSELSGAVDGLVAYYKFEGDGVSPQVVDCSPNMYDGIRMGTAAPTGISVGQGGPTDSGNTTGGPTIGIMPSGAELPQFVAEMPCIEDHSCDDVLFPKISIAKSIINYAPNSNGNVDITFEIVVANTGTTDLNDLELYDDVVTQFGAAFVNVARPIITQQPASGTLSVSTFYTGNNVNVLAGGSSLAESETFTLTIIAELDVDMMTTGMSNVANVTSNTETGGTGVTAEATSDPAMISDCFAAVPGHLTCNGALQQSVSNVTESCMVTIDPTTVLEGEDEDCFGPGMPLEGFYRISLSTTANGTPIVVSDNDDNPATTDVIESNLSAYLGQNLFYTISETGPNPNFCSGRILIEDKVAPLVTGTEEFMVTCLEDISLVNPPDITDNCGSSTTGLTIATTSVTANISPCGPNGEFLLITRTTTVTDVSGNTSDPFVQTITVKQLTPTVPADTTYSCEEYAMDNTIVDATPNGAGIPNVSAAQTGIGPATCNFDVSFEDEIVAKCGSTNGRFAILRTWTFENNCGTGAPIELVQTITVSDMVNPTVTIPATLTLEANVASGNNSTCSSSGLLPVPVLADNCSGIDPATLIINTPAGQATPVVANGVVLGYEIPAPFLELGDHTVSYTVMDSCGNSTTEDLLVSVGDNTPPVVSCDEITNLSLSNTVATALPAIGLDDGSYDLCRPTVFFKVIRMDELSGVPSTCANANVNSLLETTAGAVYFDDEALFCCEDIATNNNMVILRVFDVDPGDGPVATSRMELGGDLFGRFNDCMVEVMIEDKLPPQKLLDAPNRSIVCTDLALLNQYTDVGNTNFDAPVVMDACPVTTTLSISDATNSCGAGIISRTFTFTDDQGNATSCTQTITVTLEHDYSIVWPNDVEVSMCQIGVFGDTLSRPNSLIENGCDLLAVSYIDRRFETQSSGCYKILRTYDVINWCEWDGSSAAIAIPNPPASSSGPRLDVTASAATGNQSVLVNGQAFVNAASSPNQVQSIGRWSYTQHIKVYDDEDPILSNVVAAACDASTPTPGISCGQAVSVSFDLTDNCGNLYPVTYQLVEGAADTDGNGQISALELAQGNLLSSDPYGSLLAPAGSTSATSIAGTFTIAGNYPVGNYVAVLDVRDQCGNVSELYVPFASEDCKPPTPMGIDITVGIMATGMIDVWASDVENPNSASFDGCSAVQVSFSADVTDKVRTFTCADLGDQIVQLWVTDLAGNQSFITVTVTVEDQSGHCTPNTGTRVIAGAISNPIGNTVQNVNVSASGGYLSNMTTASNGQFAFYRINNGANVTVTPERLDQPYAGITTYDLYLIGQHILGNSLLQNPEQLIAADASNNGRVTAFDMTAIRRVLLGIDTEFANNTSWRFVDASYAFPNPSNPWQESFPEVMDYNNLTQDMMNTNFTAIKIGDLNNSAAANSRQVLAPRTLTEEFALEAKNAVLPKGESYTVTFNASDATILGYQLTLEWNPTDVEVLNIIEGAHPGSGFGKHLLQEGKLTMSHNGEMSGALFSLEVRALREGLELSEIFVAGSSVTEAGAFAKTGEQSVALRFSGHTSNVGDALEQNRPNPFTGTTQIGFTLAEAGAATLTITDVTGRVVWSTSSHFDAGLTQIEISAGELPTAGLLNYTLTAGDFTATRKMVVVK